MNVIRFECFCGQPIEANSNLSGTGIKCPSCNTDLVVPAMTPVIVPPPTIPVYTPPNQSIGWGVFKGLFGFFIILPVALIIALIVFGIAASAFLKVASNSRSALKTNEIAFEQTDHNKFNFETIKSQCNTFLENGDANSVVKIGDSYLKNKDYDSAATIYLMVMLRNKQYPREAKASLIRLGKYCYPYLSSEKQDALNELLGKDFHITVRTYRDINL